MKYYYLLFVIALFFGLILNRRCEIAYANRGSFYHIDENRKRKAKLFYIIAVFALCFFLVGLRNIAVGADTYSYVTQYFNGVQTKGIFFNSSPEIMLNLIARLSGVLVGEYQAFLLLHSLVVVLLFGHFIYKSSDNVALSLVIFLGMFFVQSMNLMREWLAIGFGINAYLFLTNNKKVLPYVFILFAIMSHISAGCLVLMPIIHYVKNKKVLFVVLLVLCLVVYVLRAPLITLVVTVIHKYAGYAELAMFINSGEFNIKDVIFIFIELFYLYTLISKPDLPDITKDKILVFASFNLIAITLSLCGGTFAILHRVVYYYSIFLIVSLPYVISFYRYKNLMVFAIALAMFAMLFRNRISDNNVISEYAFFWEHVDKVLY